jgi:hypothetical protein
MSIISGSEEPFDILPAVLDAGEPEVDAPVRSMGCVGLAPRREGTTELDGPPVKSMGLMAVPRSGPLDVSVYSKDMALAYDAELLLDPALTRLGDAAAAAAVDDKARGPKGT